MQKPSLCALVLNQILETEFWVKYKRVSLLLCKSKGDTASSCPQKLCPRAGGFGEEFYSNTSVVGLLIKLGLAQDLHSINLASGAPLILMSFSCSFNME